MCFERLKHASELRQEEEEQRAKAVSAAEAARAECDELRAAASMQAMQHEHAVAMEAAARRREHAAVSADLSACRRRIEAMVREKGASEHHLVAVQAQLQFAEGQMSAARSDVWGIREALHQESTSSDSSVMTLAGGGGGSAGALSCVMATPSSAKDDEESLKSSLESAQERRQVEAHTRRSAKAEQSPASPTSLKDLRGITPEAKTPRIQAGLLPSTPLVPSVTPLVPPSTPLVPPATPGLPSTPLVPPASPLVPVYHASARESAHTSASAHFEVAEKPTSVPLVSATPSQKAAFTPEPNHLAPQSETFLTEAASLAFSSPTEDRSSGLAMRSPAWSRGGPWCLESAE